MSLKTSTGLSSLDANPPAPLNPNPLLEMAILILAFLAMLAFGASVWTYQQPRVEFAQALNARMPGMFILGWEKSTSGNEIVVSVQSDRGWDRASNGPTYLPDRVIVARFSYAVGQETAQRGRAINARLDRDVDALWRGEIPVAFRGYYSAPPLATVASSLAGNDVGRMGNMLSGMILFLVLTFTLLPQARRDHGTRAFAIGGAIVVLVVSVMGVFMASPEQLFAPLSYLTPLS